MNTKRAPNGQNKGKIFKTRHTYTSLPKQYFKFVTGQTRALMPQKGKTLSVRKGGAKSNV